MKTPEEQAKEVELKNADLIARTVTHPLTKKQLNIILDGQNKRKAIEAEHATLLQKEGDLITFLLEFLGIDNEKLEKVGIEGDKLVIVKQKEVKPVEEKPIDMVLEKKEDQEALLVEEGSQNGVDKKD